MVYKFKIGLADILNKIINAQDKEGSRNTLLTKFNLGEKDEITE